MHAITNEKMSTRIVAAQQREKNQTQHLHLVWKNNAIHIIIIIISNEEVH